MTHCLLYLKSSTFVDDGDALAEAVREVVRARLPIVLVHENDPGAGGCEFGTFFRSTPRDLIDCGLYGSMAVAWQPPPYRDVSTRLVVQAISSSPETSSILPTLGTGTGGELEQSSHLVATISRRNNQLRSLPGLVRYAGRRILLAQRLNAPAGRRDAAIDATELLEGAVSANRDSGTTSSAEDHGPVQL